MNTADILSDSVSMKSVVSAIFELLFSCELAVVNLVGLTLVPLLSEMLLSAKVAFTLSSKRNLTG